MSDLRLKSITLRNWMTVRSAKIEFPESGLVLVLGSNMASGGKMESVGSGKTALGEALSRALLGTSREAILGKYLSDTAKNDLYVKVEAELLSKPLVVEMGYKCKEMVGDGETLRFTYADNKPIQAAKADLTRARLEKTLQVTPALAQWTVFIDGDRLKFNKMSQEDSVNLLMTALAQPPWTEYRDLVAKKLRTANDQVENSQRDLTKSKEKIAQIDEDVADALFDWKEAEKEYDRQVSELDHRIAGIKAKIEEQKQLLGNSQSSMNECKSRLKELEEEKAVQNHAWEVERLSLRDQLAILDDELEPLTERKTQAATKLDTLMDELEKMEAVPKNCPKCDRPWDKAHGQQELEEMRKKIDAADLIAEQHENVYNLHSAKRKECQTKIAEIERKMRNIGQVQEVKDLSDAHAVAERSARSLAGIIQQYELTVAALGKGINPSDKNAKQAVYQERLRLLEEENVNLKTVATNLAADQEVQRIVQYWYKAFGPNGIPNMILSDAIPLMNRVSRRISNLMTGGTLEISYSTTRELTTGESKAQLVTKVTNRIGSKRLELSSKGESGLTNLIISENLNEVGQVSERVGYRWYDEVTSGQDGVVRRSLFAYLKDIAQRNKILIFVVDHHAEAASYADYVLVAEKTVEKGTTYSWR